MQELTVFIKRWLLTWLLLAASITSFDAWLVVASAYSGFTGELRMGIPYAYYVKQPLDPWSEGDPPVPNAIETEALQVNMVVMGAIALLGTAFWPSRSPSNAPSRPSPVEGPRPTADVARRDDLHAVPLERSSRRCLRLTIIGSLLGLGWVFGGFGWLRGKALHAAHERLGRSAPWTATAAWALGRGLVCSMVVGILGMVFVR